MIVPVWLSHQTDPNKETLLYAILDNQSDTSFILEKTANELKLPSTEAHLLLSTMLAENQLIKSSKITGLSVRGFNSHQKITLPTLYTRDIMPADRDHVPTPEMTRNWPHLQRLQNEMPPLQKCDIALLLGFNVPKALEPIDVIPSSSSDGPFGQRTVLGWGIVGIIDDKAEKDFFGMSHHILGKEILCSKDNSRPRSRIILRSRVKEVIPEQVLNVLQSDFHESDHSSFERISQDDRTFLSIMQSEIKMVNGHYQMPLPLQDPHPVLSSNRYLALQRLSQLKRKLQRNHTFRNHYNTFMSELLSKGYAENAKPTTNSASVFYIPHHGVYNINKPGKVRVVFDCSAKEAGKASLNDCLLQGPDLTNSLMGVLCRFRLEPVAFLCDIEKMFYQFRVDEQHRDLLRFFWWENGNLDSDPKEYRMTVHLFGATSSPGCSNFALKQTAKDFSFRYGQHAAEFLHDDFYVDDGLKSCPTPQTAVELVKNSVAMCAESGLRLHKFATNDERVLQEIPDIDRASPLNQHDLVPSSNSIERALGIQWCIQSDMFRYKIVLKERPSTRRGILSSVSSIYDPLGFLAPLTLLGKRILQSLCQDGYDWDTEVPPEILKKWTDWKNDVQNLNDLQISRCVKPKDFGKVVKYELHHFADASSLTGYGTCSYLRQFNDKGEIHVSLIMGKSRVVPLKKITVPRLELTAAVVATNIARFLTKQLKLGNVTSYYWSDSKVVLGYIANTTRRFHVFVANRIEQIRSFTKPSQWHHVEGEINPADIASRGLSAAKLVQSDLWFRGPAFLWENNPLSECESFSLKADDPELKNSSVLATRTVTRSAFDVSRFSHVSDWYRLKRAIALCLKFKNYLRWKANSIRKTRSSTRSMPKLREITAEDLENSQWEILRLVQLDAFGRLTTGKSVPKASPLFKLDATVDDKGIIRVGGRLQHSQQTHYVRKPVVVPKAGHVTQLILRHFHERCFHQGKGITLNTLRANGFWVINAASLVGRMIQACVLCRRVRSTTQVQKMADLPADRCEESAPFSYVAMDFFGPFYVKEGRKTLKRYGCLFTCLASRAVHIEVAHSLSTDSFINALRRFMSIRGPVKLLRSDRGTNFIGAKRELDDCFGLVQSGLVKEFLMKHHCQIEFVFNPPNASHFGGVFERMIRTTRNILDVLLEQHASQLDDESLRTFMTEAAGIINTRPLTTDTLNDPLSQEPLTPNHLLMAKSHVLLPPPGEFVREDIYSRKRWRRVQYLVDQFWSRWRHEYLQNLQARSKWNKPRRNLCIGDIVLAKDQDLPRNEWKLSRIIDVKTSQDGLVRSVKIRLADSSINKYGKRTQRQVELERPVHKLVLLLESETG